MKSLKSCLAVFFALTTTLQASSQLQAFIDATPAGGSITLPAGETYTESITIPKAISIDGNGSTLDVSGLGVGISIDSDVDGVTISNFTIVGDANTYSGITVNPGASNVSILNNDISGMALSNPNGSPLSYGILCWGNANPINPPTNILIDGNEIHGVSGTAISLGDNTESVTISNNHFYDIQQVMFYETPYAIGILAYQANNLAISGNDMEGLLYASVLTSCTNVSLDTNQYIGGTSLMLLASLPNIIPPDVTPWWSLEAAATGYIYYFNSAAAQAATDAGLQAVGIPTVLSSSNPGCLDATACNYDADALTDDGSCDPDADADGQCDGEDNCTDTTACNYDDPDATECLEDDVCGECGGGNAGDNDADGICDTEDNCTDLEACNYLAYSNSVCLYPDVLGVCGGGCSTDEDQNGICDCDEECEIPLNDLDDDGCVGSTDMLIILSQYGECTSPE